MCIPAPSLPFTHNKVYDIRISKKYLNENDRILLIDDFLAKGNALLGLLDVCAAIRRHGSGRRHRH